jgi:hypothetical protein
MDADAPMITVCGTTSSESEHLLPETVIMAAAQTRADAHAPDCRGGRTSKPAVTMS